MVTLGRRRMTGFYVVDAEMADAAMLRQWISLAIAHALSLPARI